jgi:mRNA interferase MazF
MFGDVYLCQFPFTSGAASKIRPALVLFDLPWDVILSRVTSAPHAGPLDVRISDWRSAGLLRPSIARLDRIVTAEKTVLVRRLGVLSAMDLQAVRDAWNQHMRL